MRLLIRQHSAIKNSTALYWETEKAAYVCLQVAEVVIQPMNNDGAPSCYNKHEGGFTHKKSVFHYIMFNKERKGGGRLKDMKEEKAKTNKKPFSFNL